MTVTSRLSVTWLLIVITLGLVTSRAQAVPRKDLPPKSVLIQVCGESLNSVIRLVCESSYRRKRSLFLPSDYLAQEPNSIASSKDMAFALEPSDIEDLTTLFGDDLSIEDYRPLAFLLKHNALYLENDSMGGGRGSGQSEQGLSLYSRTPYLRLRRHENTGASSECCLKKCSYNTLRTYCGTNGHKY